MTRILTQPAKPNHHTTAREKALAAAAREVASELRMTDVIDLITFVRTENHPNIGDLVNSAAELYFRPGTLGYGWAAEAEMHWTTSPCIGLDLEFRNRQVTAFFKLLLRAREGGVELLYIAFDEPHPDPAVNTRRLIEAIDDARLPRVAAI